MSGHTARIAFKTEDALYEKIVDDHQFLEFNSILACVELTLASPPPRDKPESGSHGEIRSQTLQSFEHEAPEAQREKNVVYLKKVLDWLRDDKGVRRILKLVIKDNQWYQCSDETIEECLRGWDIRHLDWNKCNISVQAIRNGGAANAVQVWLTWNSQESCLVGWSDPELGLKKLLPNVRKPNLH